MSRWNKAVSSAALLFISVACFYFAPPSRTIGITRNKTISASEQVIESITTESSSVSRLLEWIGIGLLVLAAWQWRKELGVDVLGPLGAKPELTQQEAGGTPKPEHEVQLSELDPDQIGKEMRNEAMEKHLDLIMKMFSKMHALSVDRVARELGVPPKTAKEYLFYLTKIGKLRADGFPRNTIYTPTSSLENKVLDATRRTLAKKHDFLSERRFVRIGGRYDVDALLEAGDLAIIVEVKTLSTDNIAPRLENWVSQVLEVTSKLRQDRVAAVLAIASSSSASADSLRAQVAAYSFDSGSVPIQVLVFSPDDLNAQA